MNQALIGVFAKIDRAEKHLDDFKADWKQPSDPSKPVDAILGKPYLNGNQITAQVYVVAPTPTQSVWLGEILHDARSSLDSLAYQLVVKHPDRVATMKSKLGEKQFYRGVSFPIFQARDQFLGDYKVKRLQSLLDPDEFTAIQDSQPCERHKTDPAADPLAILATLNNIDKHRTILIIDKRIHMSGKVGDWEYDSVSSVTKTGTQVFSMPIAADDVGAEMNVNDPTTYILFAGTGTALDGESVIIGTRDLIRNVRSLITDEFGRFFC